MVVTLARTREALRNEVVWQVEYAVESRVVEPVHGDHRAQLARNVAQDVATARFIAEAIAQTVPGYGDNGLLAKNLSAKVKMYRKHGRDISADYTIQADHRLRRAGARGATDLAAVNVTGDWNAVELSPCPYTWFLLEHCTPVRRAARYGRPMNPGHTRRSGR